MGCRYNLGTNNGELSQLPVVSGYTTGSSFVTKKHPSSLLSATDPQVTSRQSQIQQPDAYSEHDVYGSGSAKDAFYFYAITNNSDSFQHHGIFCRNWVADDINANSAHGTPEIDADDAKLCPIDASMAEGLSGGDRYEQFYPASSTDTDPVKCYRYVAATGPNTADSGAQLVRACCYHNSSG